MPLRAAELESLFTADLTPLEKGARQAEATYKRLDGKTVTTKVDADVRTALAGVGRLEDRVRKADPTVDVDADTTRARDELGRFVKRTEESGSESGKVAGAAMAGGIVGALSTIPIAGAVVGIADTVGKAITEGFQNGLAVEVRADRLAATTDLGEAAVGRLARAAGEAYADNFGESIESNMADARLAVQSGLLDPKAAQRDAQQVISSIAGVADLVEEDSARVSRSATQLIRTGLARNAQEAFDIIVAGQQAGLNVSEDWLDTLDEYSTQWRNLGLEAPQVLGLLNQAVQAGARDTDVAADALKEFSIRARDVEDAGAREAFEDLGFSADEMQKKVAGGRQSAVEALDQTLDRLRKIENPAKRNAAAVKLFGTQAEDLGDALFAMDLDTAADQFDNLEGRASRALSTLADNTAGDLQTAQRNIDVAVGAIQGALASAFSDEISGAAEFVSENREEVVGFLLDAANAAIDFGRAIVESAASGTEALGDFGANALPPLIGAVSDLATALDNVTPGDQGSDDLRTWASSAINSLQGMDESTADVADTIRTNLIENGLDPAQEKLNEIGETALSDARLSDTTKSLSNDIAEVGYSADGSKRSMDDFDGSLDTSTRSGEALDRQIRAVRDGLDEQVRAASDAGESQKSLRSRVADARQAFIDQVSALGLTRGEAKRLADQYGLIPKRIVTQVELDLANAQAALDRFRASAIVRAQINDGRNRPGFSGGGGIHGPGTGTSDEVPILASNGEHMVTAEEVQKAGGHGAIYRWRAAIRAGLAKFAGGGAIGSASADVRRWRREMQRAQASVRRSRGTRWEDASERRLERAEERLDDARDRLSRLRDERREARTSLRRGEYTGDLGTVDELFDLARSGDLRGGQSRRLSAVARGAERQLTRIEKRSAGIARYLERARDRMEDLRDISDSVATTLTGEFSLSGASNRTNEFGETISAPTSAVGIVGSIRSTAERIRTFGGKLKQLAKKGLKGRALDEIAQLGSEQGIPVADSFLADRDQITALNAAYRGLDSAAAGAGQAVTEGFFLGGLDRAESLVGRAERTQAQLDRQADRMGDRMGRAIAKVLGIKARAGGGPVTAGGAYLVNENTPQSELFVPDQSGTIYNRSQMGALGGVATATFTDAQVALLARAVRDGAAVGLAGHERAQDRAAMYVGGL